MKLRHTIYLVFTLVLLFGGYQRIENPALQQMNLGEYRTENQQAYGTHVSSVCASNDFILKNASSQGCPLLPAAICWWECQEEQEDEAASKKRFKSFNTLYSDLFNDLSRCCFFENKVKKPSRFVTKEYRSHSRFLLFEDFRI